ncbi:hypothetical protein pb186bvf_014234 [Paramecium bursaria]
MSMQRDKNQSDYEQIDYFQQEPIDEDYNYEQIHYFHQEPIDEDYNYEQIHYFHQEPIDEDYNYEQIHYFHQEPIDEDYNYEQIHYFHQEPIDEDYNINLYLGRIQNDTNVEKYDDNLKAAQTQELKKKKYHHSQYDNLCRNYGRLILSHLKTKNLDIKSKVQTPKYDLFNQLLFDKNLTEHIRSYVNQEMLDDIRDKDKDKTTKNMKPKTSKNMKPETKQFMEQMLPKLQKAVEEGKPITKWVKIE